MALDALFPTWKSMPATALRPRQGLGLRLHHLCVPVARGGVCSPGEPREGGWAGCGQPMPGEAA